MLTCRHRGFLCFAEHDSIGNSSSSCGLGTVLNQCGLIARDKALLATDCESTELPNCLNGCFVLYKLKNAD